MYPWHDPQPVKRAWCLFEIAITLSSSVTFDIDMPSSEVKKMREDISDQCTPLITALSSIKADNAAATVSVEKDMIFSAIKTYEAGFTKVNAEVRRKIREWYIEKLEKLSAECERFDPELNLTVADVLGAFGDNKTAYTYCRKCVLFLDRKDNKQQKFDDIEPEAVPRKMLKVPYGGSGNFCD